VKSGGHIAPVPPKKRRAPVRYYIPTGRAGMRNREHSVKLMAEAQRLTIGKRVGEREGISR
jgi:hypothetical protein